MNMRMRAVAVAGAALLVASGLTACSGSESNYCDTMKSIDSDKTLKNLDPGKDKEAMNKVIDAVKKAEGAAPSEVKEEWGRFRTMMEKFANLDQEALKKDPQKAMEALKDFDLTKLQADLEKIGKHAKEKCNIDMNTK